MISGERAEKRREGEAMKDKERKLKHRGERTRKKRKKA